MKKYCLVTCALLAVFFVQNAYSDELGNKKALEDMSLKDLIIKRAEQAKWTEPDCISRSKAVGGECFMYSDLTRDKKCKDGRMARQCPEDFGVHEKLEAAFKEALAEFKRKHSKLGDIKSYKELFASPKCEQYSKIADGQGPSCFRYTDGTADKKCKDGSWNRTCPEDLRAAGEKQTTKCQQLGDISLVEAGDQIAMKVGKTIRVFPKNSSGCGATYEDMDEFKKSQSISKANRTIAAAAAGCFSQSGKKVARADDESGDAKEPEKDTVRHINGQGYSEGVPAD